MSEVRHLNPEGLRKIIASLPNGRARQRYERLLAEKNRAPLRAVQWEEPTLYFLGEVLALRTVAPGEIEEIHKAKLAFPGARLVQDSPERFEQ